MRGECTVIHFVSFFLVFVPNCAQLMNVKGKSKIKETFVEDFLHFAV